MAKRALADSSFYIHRMRSRLDPFAELEEAADEWEILTCGVVMTEVLRGMQHEKARDRMQKAMDCMIYVPTLNAVWQRVAKLAWELDRKGLPMQVTDLLIAACALEADAAVLTLDSDFRRVPGLAVVPKLF